MPNFEVFTKRLVPLSKEPTVTVQKKGILSLNASAYAAIGEAKSVELLYDKQEQIIGIRPVDENTADHAYPVRPSGARSEGSFLISGIAFAKYYGFPTDIATRRKAFMEGDTLCIDLKDPGTQVTGNRRRRIVVPDGDAASRGAPWETAKN